ncbi:MAG: sigma-54-dependent transcriptional regulator [bacterium]
MKKRTIILGTASNDSFKNLKIALENQGYDVLQAKDGPAVIDLYDKETPELAVLDLSLPKISGIEVLRILKKKCSRFPVMVVANHVSTNTAIETMKLGAYDYITQPFEITKMLDIINTALSSDADDGRRIAINPGTFAHGSFESDTIIGNSREMLEIYKMIGQVAQSDAPVLIQGESGTGKELIARAIFHHSSRSEKEFLAINCAAIPEQLLESELFGHEKGSFTGALSKKIGKFEQCDGGTIFLDEIGDMALSAQSKVLRVLQDQVFERVGGHESIKVDVRLIAATNKSLVQAVKEGTFRVDLFYRLKVISLFLPPLRERPEDIALLADYFLLKYRHKLKKEINGIAHSAMMLLTQYHWPGNIRELENVIQSSIVLCKGDVILPEHLPIGEMMEKKKRPLLSVSDLDRDYSEMFEEILTNIVDNLIDQQAEDIAGRLTDGLEKAMIGLTLKKVNNNQVKASKVLGISRNTLRSKIEKFTL